MRREGGRGKQNLRKGEIRETKGVVVCGNGGLETWWMGNWCTEGGSKWGVPGYESWNVWMGVQGTGVMREWKVRYF